MEIAPKEKGRYYLSALALCDGDLLNDDFDYYLSIVGRRTKEIGLGTYGNGANRNRPMLIFASPLGISQLDRKVTLIHSSDQLAAVYKGLRLTYLLQRTTKSGQARKFYCYQSESDVPSDWSVRTLSNPFPEVDREQRTQPRGKFRLNFRTLE
jgi:hypothetical protein